MVARDQFSKGGSSAFLKTLNRAPRSNRKGGTRELIPIMVELKGAPRTIEELAKKFPLAHRIVDSLISDGMVERMKTDDGEEAVALSKTGRDFMDRRALY